MDDFSDEEVGRPPASGAYGDAPRHAYPRAPAASMRKAHAQTDLLQLLHIGDGLGAPSQQAYGAGHGNDVGAHQGDAPEHDFEAINAGAAEGDDVDDAGDDDLVEADFELSK